MFRPVVFAGRRLLKLGSYPPTEKGDRDPVFLNNCCSKGWLPGPGGRCSWIVRLARGQEKIYLLYKRAEKELAITSFGGGLLIGSMIDIQC